MPEGTFKDPTYEAVELGETFGPLDVLADDHYAKAACFCLDDHAPWYTTETSPLGRRLVPSPQIAKDLVALFLTKYDADRVVGLHQKEEVWYHKPVPVGTRLALTGRYVDKYQRRGKGYVVLDCEARDEAGDLCVRQRSTEIMRIPDKVELGAGGAGTTGRRVEPIWDDGAPTAARAAGAVTAGTQVAPLVKRAWQDQMAVFSGCGKHWHNIHTDIHVAHAAGFKGTLAQGMMETCWISEMLCGFFGFSWLSSGWLEMAYINPVYENDIITCKARVTGRDNGAEPRLALEVWCENQDGVMTAAGWAAGRP